MLLTVVGALRGLEHGVVAVAIHDQQGGLPDIAVVDHRASRW